MIGIWLGAVLTAWLATLVVERFAHAVGAVAKPNPIVPQHRQPVAYLGGIGVLCGLAVGVFLIAPRTADLASQPDAAWAAGALLFAAFGAWDDASPFRPGPKFVAQVAVAAVPVSLGLGQGVSANAWIDAALALTCVLVLVNAVNFTDVCDGLVATVAAVSFLAAAWLLTPAGTGWPVAASGACVGFLLRNRPPARVFLGDAGSHLIGFLLAAACLSAAQRDPLTHASVAGILVCGVFLFELVFITAVRVRKGLPWWRGSPDHFSLRLQAAGWSRTAVDTAAGLAAGLLAALAWALPTLGPLAALFILGTVGAWVARGLLRYEVTNARPRE